MFASPRSIACDNSLDQLEDYYKVSLRHYFGLILHDQQPALFQLQRAPNVYFAAIRFRTYETKIPYFCIGLSHSS